MIMAKGQPPDEDFPVFSSVDELNRHLAEMSRRVHRGQTYRLQFSSDGVFVVVVDQAWPKL